MTWPWEVLALAGVCSPRSRRRLGPDRRTSVVSRGHRDAAQGRSGRSTRPTGWRCRPSLSSPTFPERAPERRFAIDSSCRSPSPTCPTREAALKSSTRRPRPRSAGCPGWSRSPTRGWSRRSRPATRSRSSPSRTARRARGRPPQPAGPHRERRRPEDGAARALGALRASACPRPWRSASSSSRTPPTYLDDPKEYVFSMINGTLRLAGQPPLPGRARATAARRLHRDLLRGLRAARGTAAAAAPRRGRGRRGQLLVHRLDGGGTARAQVTFDRRLRRCRLSSAWARLGNEALGRRGSLPLPTPSSSSAACGRTTRRGRRSSRASGARSSTSPTSSRASTTRPRT